MAFFDLMLKTNLSSVEFRLSGFIPLPAPWRRSLLLGIGNDNEDLDLLLGCFVPELEPLTFVHVH